MKGAWQDRFPRALVISVAIAVVSSGLLLAQTAEDERASTAIAGSPRLAAGAQPAEATATDGGPAGEAVPNEVRKRMLSGLIGSKHDFGEERDQEDLGPTVKDDESGRDLCVTCHTPYLGGVPARLGERAGQPQMLRPYQGINVELDGWSLLCLGCHDGTTAPDVYTSSHATTISSQLGNSRLGVRGLRSHPVGVRYAPQDEKYHPRAAVEAAGLKLPNGRIQCTTCHDPHNTHGHPGMLKTSNHRSRLCLTCHRL